MAREPLYCQVDMSATGSRICALRKSKGLTVRDVQQYMGFENRMAIYKWERGMSVPSVRHLKVLSQIFGVPIDDILIWNSSPHES